MTMLNPAFAGELFGAGQPLDASRYFIIRPDAPGAGRSAKPSDGLRAKFPRHNYDDMVQAQYRLVTEVLGIRHLCLVMANSMGGMHTWLWGVKYPDFMDALAPMASQAHRDGQPQLDGGWYFQTPFFLPRGTPNTAPGAIESVFEGR